MAERQGSVEPDTPPRGMRPDADDVDIDPSLRDRVGLIMSRVNETDFERVDPPGSLWGQIAASITSEASRTPVGSGTVVAYFIDANDVVFPGDEGWAAFARDNSAPELVELDSARTLWTYFNSDEVRDLWRALIQQIRAKQTRAHLPLRCDAPDTKRWFEMTITPGPNSEVHFRSLLVFEEPRSSVSLLNMGTEVDAGTPAVPVCSWCGKAHDGSQWREIEEVSRDLRLLEDLMPAIVYGICPSCRDLMSSDLLAYDDTRSSPT